MEVFVIAFIMILLLVCFYCCVWDWDSKEDDRGTHISVSSKARSAARDSPTFSRHADNPPYPVTNTGMPMPSSPSYGTRVTVNSQPTPVVNPPYPLGPAHPLPHSGAAAPGFTTIGDTSPYPTNVGMPMPAQSGPYPPAGNAPYPPASGAPYPPASMAPYPPASGAPYPPASGAPYPPTSGGAPYPPASGGAPYSPTSSSDPPPYHIAVSQPPIQPPTTREGFGKQAPYNPDYNG